MMDSEAYKIFSRVSPINGLSGGQELIMFEIMSLLYEYRRIYLPFLSSNTLYHHLSLHRFDVWITEGLFDVPNVCEAVYFGTPTIVNDHPLFPQSLESPHYWNKETERQWVRQTVLQCERYKYKRIVSGLGSGDISPRERLDDMGGGKIVCYKDFGSFKDWVFVRDL